MIARRRLAAVVTFCILCSVVGSAVVVAQSVEERRQLSGEAAFTDWRADAPGVRRLIRPSDVPLPDQRSSADNEVRVVRRPQGAHLRAPPGFDVAIFARDLARPRALRVAPNGDVFVAETRSGRITVLRPTERS